MSRVERILRDFFDAINRNDIAAAVGHFAPEIVRIEPEGHATSGTHRGISAVRDHLMAGRGTWAEGRCDAEEIHMNRGRVVVFLHARVRLKAKTEWIDGRFADGFELKDDRIALYQTFWERSEAMAWAGLAD